MPSKIDWERLCETPFIKVGHRVAAMLLVPIMLCVGAAFVHMYVTISALPHKLEAIDARQERFDERLRFMERREW